MSVLALITAMLPHWPDSERQRLAAQFAQAERQHWAKGDCLFMEQRGFGHLVLIETGLVRSFYLDHDTEINLRFLCDGSLAVPFAALAQAWCSATCSGLIAGESVQCVTAVTGYRLPLHTLLDRAQFADWERLRTELAARHYLSMEQRLRMIQHQRARDRYRKFMQWMPEPIVLQMPNLQVASYLGLSAEALSRVKQQARLS
ncbi:MAG: Crp/Fnr family transcriptional regulator [Moraxellaceae bacterium]